MAKQIKGRKFFAATASAALVASAIVPVASAAEIKDADQIPAWAKEAVQALVEGKVIEGDQNGYFNPSGTVTRAVAAQILTKALGLSTAGTENFSDVKEGAWYYDAVVATSNAGIFKGNDLGQFDPNGLLTREQAASVIVRAFGLEGSADLSKFADADKVAGWAKEDMAIAVANGVIKGNGTSLNPKASITRAEIAVMVQRTIEEVSPDPVETELKVESVSAITSTSVTVKIAAPAEDLVDQTVVVKDGAGKTYVVNPATIKAGATTATFNFATPLTVNPTEQWTVNGVAYKASELAITGVEAVDNKGKYINVQFNQKVTNLDASEIIVRHKVNQKAYAVESVKVSTDGYSALVTLIGNDANQGILDVGQRYTLTITKNGKVTAGEFVIPDVIEDTTVTAVRSKDNTITIKDKGAKKLAKDVVIDFQEALGRDITVWLNEDNEITKYVYSEETVELDAVKITKKDDKWRATTVNGDKTYEFNLNAAKTAAVLSAGEVTLTDGLVYDSAKIVIGKDGKVQSFISYGQDFDSNVLLVDKVTNTYVQSVDSELNLSDYSIIKNGKTIKITDIQKGDVLFYNTSNKIAEVYNNKVSGTISDFYAGEFRLNGTKYTYGDADQRILVDDEFVQIDKDEIAPFTGAVEVYLDRTGKVKFITGEEVASNLDNPTYITSSLAAYELAKEGYVRFTSQDAAGKTTAQTIKLDTLKEIGEFKVGKEHKNAPDKGKISYFELVEVEGEETTWNIVAFNKDEKEIAPVLEDVEAAGAKGNVVEVIKNTNDEIIGLNFAEEKGRRLAKEAKSTDKTITVGSTAYKIDANTPVFVEIETGKANSSTWGKVNTSKINTEDGVWVFADDEKQVVEYVLIKHDSKALSDDANFDKAEAVITSVSKDTDGDLAEISAYVNGEEKTYKVDLLDDEEKTIYDVSVGQIVDLQLTKNDTPVVKTINKDKDILSDETAPGVYTYVPNTTLTSSGKIVVKGKEIHTIESSAKYYELTTDLNGKPVVKKYDGLASFKAEADKLEGKQITVSTIAAGNKSVDIVVLSDATDAPEAIDATLKLAETDGVKFTAQTGVAPDVVNATLAITFDKAVVAEAADLFATTDTGKTTKLATVAATAAAGAEKLVITFEEDKAATDAVTYTTFDVVVPENTEANTKETTFTITLEATAADTYTVKVVKK